MRLQDEVNISVIPEDKFAMKTITVREIDQELRIRVLLHTIYGLRRLLFNMVSNCSQEMPVFLMSKGL